MCQPPQTYSRLFRPWDNKNENNDLNMHATNSHIEMIKNEYCATAGMNSRNIDIINTQISNIDNEENDCSLSNISANSIFNPNYDDFESDSASLHTSSLRTTPMHTPPLHTPPSMSSTDGQSTTSNASSTSAAYYHGNQFQTLSNTHQPTALSTQHYHQPLTMFSGMTPATTNSVYFAAAAAAATANGLTMAPTLTPMATNFGMEPTYSIGVMEHEYARVMAEEAHIKALNARKQRPKKFKCPHCDVAFSNNGQLKGHIRIHTGERPYKCDAEGCGKTFTRNEELTRHKRIHTGLRPFPCSICGKKFGRRDHLKKHMKTHIPQDHPFNSTAAFFMPMYPYMYGL